MAGLDPPPVERLRRGLVSAGLVFGIAELAWNAWVVAGLIAGGEPLRPGTVVQVVLQVATGFVLIGLAIVSRRQRPAA